MQQRSTAFIRNLIVYGALTAFLSTLVIAIVVVSLPTPESDSRAEVVHSVLTKPITARAWGVFDPTTGMVTDGQGFDEVLPIASVSKLFTAYVVMESSRKDDAFTITVSDLGAEGRAGKLSYGQRVTPYSLLFPLLIESSNDAGAAIARYMGDEFQTTMSTLVDTLRIRNTTLVEPSGLSAQNVSTVRDLATFFTYLQKTHPHAIDITRVHTYLTGTTGYRNNNPLVSMRSFAGGKYGFTDEAERTFVGMFAADGSREHIGVVVLGSTDIVADIKAILASRGDVVGDSGIIVAP